MSVICHKKRRGSERLPFPAVSSCQCPQDAAVGWFFIFSPLTGFQIQSYNKKKPIAPPHSASDEGWSKRLNEGCQAIAEWLTAHVEVRSGMAPSHSLPESILSPLVIYLDRGPCSASQLPVTMETESPGPRCDR